MAPHAVTEVREAIQEALEAADVRALRNEDFRAGLAIEMIPRADLVIADVSDADPYTFYQVGLADGLRKPVQLIAQKATQLLP